MDWYIWVCWLLAGIVALKLRFEVRCWIQCEEPLEIGLVQVVSKIADSGLHGFFVLDKVGGSDVHGTIVLGPAEYYIDT